MEHNNQNDGHHGYPPILFITAEHLMKLLGKCRSIANDHLKEMREQYHIVKPSKVTLDIACEYFTITRLQFYQKYYGY